MPFSLGSYLLGVGTVVGALAFGFGGGLLLTHTAMKESPAGQTRVERLARAESDTRRARGTQITPATNRGLRRLRTKSLLLIRIIPHQSALSNQMRHRNSP